MSEVLCSSVLAEKSKVKDTVVKARESGRAVQEAVLLEHEVLRVLFYPSD